MAINYLDKDGLLAVKNAIISLLGAKADKTELEPLANTGGSVVFKGDVTATNSTGGAVSLVELSDKVNSLVDGNEVAF